MSGRHGLNDDIDDQWAFIKWRGQVESAIKGKHGQKFLKEMLRALDALPEKRLITDTLQDKYDPNSVCALGAVARLRGLDLNKIVLAEGETYEEYADYDYDDDAEERVHELSGHFQIAHQMIREIIYMNDEGFYNATPEQRFERMRKWIDSRIHKPKKRSKPWAYWEAGW